jgi:predicted MFS family arabinose efflux permease
MGAASGLFAWLATRRDGVPVRRRQVPIIWLLRRYHPGPILVMGVTMGFGLGLSTTFLRPFAASLRIPSIATFFGIYATTAFITRMSIRRLPERIGIRSMVLIGVACLSINMLSYLPVRLEWHLILPAIIIGVAHALLFPAVVAGGSSAFPDRYRGLGTTLMLAMFDLGMLIGSPTAGSILRVADVLGFPKYPSMFITLSFVFALLGIWYAIRSRGEREMTRMQRIDASLPAQRLALPEPARCDGG